MLRGACAQFLAQWRAPSRQRDPCFDACVCAVLQSVASVAADQGLAVLQATGVRLVLQTVADADAAGLILCSLLRLPQCKGTRAGVCATWITSISMRVQI